MEKKLVILDGNNIIHRGYHIFKKLDLKTSKGFPTTAIYGYRNIIRKLYREHRTEHFVVVFDTPVQTHRHKIYPEYKSGREKKHTLREQYETIYKMTGLAGVRYFMEDGFEADDIIYTLVEQNYDKFDSIIVESTDKDLHQLIRDNVFQVIGNNQIINEESLQSKYEIKPESMRMFIALVGDSPNKGDNIPGCVGVGKVAAKQLSKNFPTIDDLDSGLGTILPKMRKKITSSWDNIVLSYKLVGLVEVPSIIKLTVNDLKKEDTAKVMLQELYDELEFRS
jgi:DNA polymerase-1